jgi:hypothetical protein
VGGDSLLHNHPADPRMNRHERQMSLNESVRIDEGKGEAQHDFPPPQGEGQGGG